MEEKIFETNEKPDADKGTEKPAEGSPEVEGSS